MGQEEKILQRLGEPGCEKNVLVPNVSLVFFVFFVFFVVNFSVADLRPRSRKIFGCVAVRVRGEGASTAGDCRINVQLAVNPRVNTRGSPKRNCVPVGRSVTAFHFFAFFVVKFSFADFVRAPERFSASLF